MTAPRYAVGSAIVTRTDIGVDAQTRCGNIADAIETVKTINRTEGGTHGIMDESSSMLIAVAVGGEIFHRSIDDGRFCPYCGRAMADGHKWYCPLPGIAKKTAHRGSELTPDLRAALNRSLVDGEPVEKLPWEGRPDSNLCPECGGDGLLNEPSHFIDDDTPCEMCGGVGSVPL